MVRGTFSPARAWCPAVVARLACTLGVIQATVAVRSPDHSLLVPAVPSEPLDAGALAAKVRGRRVSNVTTEGAKRLIVHLEDSFALVLQVTEDGLSASVRSTSARSPDKSYPTQRQYEYLLFIAKYFARFGRAPAESDIERHFLVSAPSVNRMMQMLERRGFIARQPGVPRSTKLCVDLSSFGPPP